MKQVFTALRLYCILTIVTGFFYTFFITCFAQYIFTWQANGSLISRNNTIMGSKLICQQFNSSKYFWPRPSSTGYNTMPSGGSNACIISLEFQKVVQDRRMIFQSGNGLPPQTEIPQDMLFSSGSGIDPHISQESARLQIERIVRERHYTMNQKQSVISLVERLTEKPQFGFLGLTRINVLQLNMALDSNEVKYNAP